MTQLVILILASLLGFWFPFTHHFWRYMLKVTVFMLFWAEWDNMSVLIAIPFWNLFVLTADQAV